MSPTAYTGKIRVRSGHRVHLSAGLFDHDVALCGARLGKARVFTLPCQPCAKAWAELVAARTRLRAAETELVHRADWLADTLDVLAGEDSRAHFRQLWRSLQGDQRLAAAVRDRLDERDVNVSWYL